MRIEEFEHRLYSSDIERLKEPNNPLFIAAVMVLLVEIAGEYHFVFEKRANGIRQEGEICFPGGKFNKKDKDYLATALRETSEELGCLPDQIEYMAELSPIYMASGKQIYSYLGKLTISPNQLTLNDAEVADLLTVPVRFFQENLPKRYYCQIKIHPQHVDLKTNQIIVDLPTKELRLPKRYEEPWGDGREEILVYSFQGEKIWGLTAKIIASLLNKI